jgi:tetratricopeptide (TPR) repeat protein
MTSLRGPTTMGLVLAAGLAVTVFALTARAEEPVEVERAKESFRAGATAYAAGDYLAAIQALDSAYALTPLPAIAFSLAQAERRQYFVGHDRAHLERAIGLYRRYIDQVPSAGRRADALDALSQLEPLAAALAAGQLRATPTGAGAPASSGSPGPGSGSPPRATRLMITTEAPEARLSLDGDPPSASPLIREVEPGRHRVDVSAPGFFPEARDLLAVAGELIPVTMSLRERPGTLVVSTPADADLYVDGIFMSRGGERVPLQLWQGAHRLSVAEKGHRVAVEEIALGAGETRDISVILRETWQRRTARALFIGGAVALGSGILFGVLAVGAEDRAQEFLRKQAMGPVTSAELGDYHGAVADRDRDRLLTVIGLGSAAGLLTSGLFLHETDRPDPEDLSPRDARRPTRDPRPPSTTAATQLRLAPMLRSGWIGAEVGGRF